MMDIQQKDEESLSTDKYTSTSVVAKTSSAETVSITPGIDIKSRLFENEPLPPSSDFVTPNTLTMSSKFERATPLSSLTFAPEIKSENSISLVASSNLQHQTTSTTTAPPVTSTVQTNTLSDETTMITQSEDSENDVTTTKKSVDDADTRYLFDAVGNLLERTKETHELTTQIPELITTINTMKAEINTTLADISARVLLVEEDVKTLKTFLFTKDGKNITMSNKSRITRIEEDLKSTNESIKSLFAARNEAQDATIAYGWDEMRVTDIENKLSALIGLQQQLMQRQSSDLQQSQQQQPQSSPPPPPPNPPPQQQQQQQQQQTLSNQAKKKKHTPRSYKDVTVKQRTLLLTDSNGRCIQSKRFHPKGGVQRHTYYTLDDVQRFVK